MDKTKINSILVVEGVTDVAFMESFIEAEFVITNGSDVPRETIEYLQTLSLVRDIIVLTDPDSPGKRIRDILDKAIPNLKHAYIDKRQSVRNGKVGVAQSTKEEILKSLSSLVTNKSIPEGHLTIEDLFTLHLTGFSGSAKGRELLGRVLHIGNGSSKTMLKRLNSINVDLHTIETILKKEGFYVL
jgi:ribonuclease M5